MQQHHVVDMRPARAHGISRLAANDPQTDQLLLQHAEGREVLTGEMVREARAALACYGAGNQVGFQAHRIRARDIADLLECNPPRDPRGGAVDWTLQTR